MSDLIYSVIMRETEKVKKLIQSGIDVNKQTYDGNTALMIAISDNNVDIVKILLEVSNTEIENENNETALMIATGRNDLIELVLQYANPNYQNKFGRTALMNTTNLDIINLLIKHGADVNIQDNNGYTALMIAVITGYLEHVNLLLSFANPNLLNNYNQTALYFASNNIEIVQSLLKFGADVNNGSSALIPAIVFGRLDIVKLLIDSEISPNGGLFNACHRNNFQIVRYLLSLNIYTDEKDRSLLLVSNRCNIEIAKLLLENGADPNVYDEDDCTPLMIGLQFDSKFAECILDYPIDINFRNKEGNTALMIASVENHISIVERLLKLGANPNIQNNKGYTALMLATGYNNVEIINLLLLNDADVNLQNNQGHTVLMMSNSIEVFLKFGANPDIQDIYGNTVLMHSVDPSLVKTILKFGTNLNIQDFRGNTALMIAVKKQYLNIIEILLPEYTLDEIYRALSVTVNLNIILLLEKYL